MNKSLKNIKKILVIQLGPFGDIFLTTAYFKILKEKFPDANLWYLIKKKYHNVVKDHPYIDEFLFLEHNSGLNYYWERIKIIKTIRKIKFDIIIDQQNKNSTRLFTLFSGAKWKVGYKDARFSFVYNIKAKRGPEIYSPSKKFDLVKPLGIKRSSYKLYYSISDQSKQYIENWLSKNKIKKYFVISPGSPVSWKKWKIGYYAKISDMIKKIFDLTPIWLWGPGERTDARTGAELMEQNSYIAPPTTLNQAASLLENAEIFLCNDGGINHLAVTTGVKTLAFFGDTEPQVWSPAGEFKNHHHMYNPNHNSKEDNTFGYSPEEVIKKVKSILTSGNE